MVFFHHRGQFSLIFSESIFHILSNGFCMPIFQQLLENNSCLYWIICCLVKHLPYKARATHGDFLATFCRRFRGKWRCLIFSTIFCWWFKGGEKIKLIKIHFKAEFHSSMWNVDSALSYPGCSTPNVYVRHWQVTCSPQNDTEKKLKWNTWMQSHLFQCDLLILRNRPQILVGKNRNV